MEYRLKNGSTILIDEADLHVATSMNWKDYNGYVFCDKQVDGVRTRYYLHRVIMDAPVDKVVDHINGNAMDNRRSNLRICSQEDNARNRAKSTAASKSIYKGVKPRRGKFEANIGRGARYEYLGTYEKEIDAAIAYNLAALSKYGEFARLNDIPFDYSDYIPRRFEGTSRYRGVSFSARQGKWTASIQVNKKRKRLGYFDDEISAAMAYNEAAKELLGDKAKLNEINV